MRVFSQQNPVTCAAYIFQHPASSLHQKRDLKGLIRTPYQLYKIMLRLLNHHAYLNVKVLLCCHWWRILTGKNISRKISSMAAKLFANELKNGNQPKNNKRYNDNWLRMSVCYHSGSSYERLRKVFSLPTTRTLRNHLSSVGCEPGILHNVIDQVKENIKNKKRTAECTLIFDETPLQSGAHWDPQMKTYLGKPTVTDSDRRYQRRRRTCYPNALLLGQRAARLVGIPFCVLLTLEAPSYAVT